MLILTQQGQTTRLQRQPFQDEAALQQYISAHPEAIPLSEAGDDAQLHVLGRELPTASGPIDIFGTDPAAHAYIIETKLYKNPDKRMVLAQVLDYGAALWAEEPSIDTVLEALRHDASKRAAPEPLSSLASFLGADEDKATDHLERVCDALADGRFTAIILMDHLDARLRDLIRFMNENSRFLVLAVELDYYRHADAEFVYPRLFGAETRRPAEETRRRRSRVDPEAYFEEYALRLGPEAVELWRSIEEAVRSSGISGLDIGHRPRGSPYVYLSNPTGRDIQLLSLADHAVVRDALHINSELFDESPEGQRIREQFRSALLRFVPGAEVSGTVSRVYMPLKSLADARAQVMSALADLVQALRARGA